MSFLLILFGICFIIFTVGFFINLKIRKQIASLKRNGIPYIGSGLLGSIKFFMGSVNIAQMEEGLYRDALKTKAPIVGTMDFSGTPILVATDLELIKSILVKDFDHFVNRRPFGTKTSSKYFKRFLFSMEGEQWRGIRIKMSPTFTTGRIRSMFQIFDNSSSRMVNYIMEQTEYPEKKSRDIDFVQIFSKYALDVIAGCAFGIDSKSFDVPPHQVSTFEQMAKQFCFKFSGKTLLKFLLITAAPNLADFFEIDILDYEAQNYLSSVVKNEIKRRRQTGERREDFLQLMLDAQQGLLQADEETSQVMNGFGESGFREEKESKILTSGDAQKKVRFDDDDLIANGMLFIMAGFDGTQTALIFALYLLALQPEMQENLYKEVMDVLSKNEGQLTYNGISEMSLLDQVVGETMRQYTSTRLERCCTKDYNIPGTDIKIPKGSVIVIPVYGLAHDPQYFPEPEKFILERFSQENKAFRNPYAYMPFGHGPRNCIGSRFALIKVKTAIVQLIRSFQFKPCSRTKMEIEFEKNPSLKPKGGMWLSVTAREKY